MIISYATKRDKTYGRRKVLIIDHEKKIYSANSTSWFCREDFVEISATDRKRLLTMLKLSDYTMVDNLQVVTMNF